MAPPLRGAYMFLPRCMGLTCLRHVAWGLRVSTTLGLTYLHHVGAYVSPSRWGLRVLATWGLRGSRHRPTWLPPQPRGRLRLFSPIVQGPWAAARAFGLGETFSLRKSRFMGESNIFMDPPWAQLCDLPVYPRARRAGLARECGGSFLW